MQIAACGHKARQLLILQAAIHRAEDVQECPYQLLLGCCLRCWVKGSRSPEGTHYPERVGESAPVLDALGWQGQYSTALLPPQHSWLLLLPWLL